GVIAPGGAIMDIVPEREELMIDAEVSIMDIDRVKAGLLADVRFSVFNQAITPEVEGEVLTVSADRLVNEDNGMPYYLAQVKITQESQEKLKGFVLQPGMPAEVFINTGDRTLFEYLTQPVSNAFARALIEE
ncbi:MAG: HlyD family efflux transporter periplasmic adaptor subunit, partial [Methylococcales bacterium]|nr:HlyD family efflux transporter periplasmic adaptor subunit [Methylococcales bacterium]